MSKIALVGAVLVTCISLAARADQPADPDVAKLRTAFREASGDDKVKAATTLLAGDPDSAAEVLTFLYETFRNHKTGAYRFKDAIRSGAANAVPQLIKDLVEAKEAKQRFAAAALVANYQVSREPLESLLKAKDASTRRLAVETLGSSYAGAYPSLPALRPLLKDPNAEVRLATALAMLYVDRREATTAMPVLVEEYAMASSRERSRMVTVATRFGIPLELSSDLLRKALKDEDLRTQSQAAEHLIGTSVVPAIELVSIFRKQLKNDTLHQQVDAMDALARIGRAAEGSLPQLEHRLESEDEQLRGAAARAIAVINPTRSEAMLPHVLTELRGSRGYSSERLATIQCLGSLGPVAASAAPIMRKMVKQKREPLRISLAAALLRIDPEHPQDALNAMRDFLAGKVNSYVPDHAYDGLAVHVVPLLPDVIRVLKADDDKGSLYDACDLLREMGPRAAKAVPALEDRIRRTKDEDVQGILRATLAAVRDVQ